MHKGRMEAFTDGVMAIIITIMVLELKIPEGTGWAAMASLGHGFLGYVLSFLYVGIYWNNHHHLMQAHRRVNGAVLWANLHLLFWLSLLPLASRWIGEVGLVPDPLILFGGILSLSGIAYFILEHALERADGGAVRAVRTPMWKGVGSELLYLIGMALAWSGQGWAAFVVLWGPALMWFIPDRRIERALADNG